MTKTSTNCPRCRQPIAADIEQLFDLHLDPGAKQKLLNGAYNFVQCPVCGYAGSLSLPIAYHDPEKELMLTYFPPDLGVPVNEQERMLGPMITKVMGRLPPEKRKAYLLRPETMLTMETMVERILNADGITKEMIQGQKQRVALLQRLIRVSGEERNKITKQEEAIIDQEFFGILNRIIEATLAQGDQTMARELATMQKELLSITEVGREILDQSREVQETIKSLQEASKNGLTREKLLDLILENPSDTRLSIVVSMARAGMDYTFFQILSTKVETASEVEKANLVQLREQLLEMTKEYDVAVSQRVQDAQQLLEEFIRAENVEEAMVANLDAVDDIMLQLIRAEHEKATQQSDLKRLSKLEQIIEVLQKASAPPPEVVLIEQLLETKDEESSRKMLEENAEQITPAFLQMLSGMTAQIDSKGTDAGIVEKLKKISTQALRFSMEANLKRAG